VDGNDRRNISAHKRLFPGAPNDSKLIWGRFQRFAADVPKAEANGFGSTPVVKRG
jgi:hypothetical protein